MNGFVVLSASTFIYFTCQILDDSLCEATNLAGLQRDPSGRGGGGGILPYMGYIGMCRGIWYGSWGSRSLYRVSFLPIRAKCFRCDLKVLLRSKFNVKFVTKTLSFQLIRSGYTCFGHWNELWRPLSENIELQNAGFSRPPLQIYVLVTKLLFWLWRHFLNTPRKQTWTVRKLRAILKRPILELWRRKS